METTEVPSESVNQLQAAFAEATKLADGEAIAACDVLLDAVGEFLAAA